MTTFVATRSEQLVNTTTLNDQSAPCIVKLAQGYVVVWQSLQAPAGYNNPHAPAGYDIYMQRYSDSGVALGGEERVNSVTFNDQVQPTVVALADGGFAIAWASARELSPTNFDYGVYLQRYDAAGAWLGGETHVNDFYGLNQQRPAIAALSGGGYVVTWASDTQSPHPPGVYAKLIGADGVALGGDIRIDTATSGMHTSPAAVGLADGGYVIVWDGNGEIHAQRFDAGGIAQGDAARVNTTLADFQSGPAVTALADGGWLVAWESSGQDGSGSGIYFQRYDASGAAAGAETQANSTAAGNQGAPSVAALSDGGFLVAWESFAQDGSGSGLYAQRFDAAGQADGAETRVNTTAAGDQSGAAIAATDDGGFLAAWMSYQQDGSGWGVYSKVFSTDEALRAGGGQTEGFVHGTAGLDTAIIQSDLAGILGYSFNAGVLSVTTAHGTQHIDHVERIRLTDALFALDTQGPEGHVWQAAALCTAAFGTTPDCPALSQWTAQADRSSNMGELGQAMIDFYAPGISSQSLVAHLYRMVTGQQAASETVQAFVGQIGAGGAFATQGELFAYAASLELNSQHMAGVVGSIQQLEPAWF